MGKASRPPPLAMAPADDDGGETNANSAVADDQPPPPGGGGHHSGGRRGGGGRPENPETKLFVGNLNYATTQQTLHVYFEQFGEIQEVRKKGKGRRERWQSANT
jgi:hypothetical protein